MAMNPRPTPCQKAEKTADLFLTAPTSLSAVGLSGPRFTTGDVTSAVVSALAPPKTRAALFAGRITVRDVTSSDLTDTDIATPDLIVSTTSWAATSSLSASTSAVCVTRKKGIVSKTAHDTIGKSAGDVATLFSSSNQPQSQLCIDTRTDYKGLNQFKNPLTDNNIVSRNKRQRQRNALA